MKFWIISLLIFITASALSLQKPGDYNYVEEEEEEYFYDTTKTMKGLAIDLGYGLNGGSLTFGFRYGMFSAHMGFAGILDNPPNYSYRPPDGVSFSQSEPLPTGYSEEEFTGTSVYGDIGIHLAYLETLTFFTNVGYYSQRDTILARSTDGLYYRYATRAHDGITFGGGAEFTLSQWVRISAGYHTKRGVFGRFTYTWR